MQPILTAFAAPLIGERVRPRQWLGLMFGLSGVALVVYAKISLVGLSWQAIALAVFALLSITAGTLYQKHFCPQFDLRTGTVIQFAASFAAVLPFALLLEDMGSVQWVPEFFGAWAWSVLALSIGAIFLLFALIRRSDATQVTSLLYLTPPTTAIMWRASCWWGLPIPISSRSAPCCRTANCLAPRSWWPAPTTHG